MRFLFSSLVLVSALAATAPAFGQALSAQDEAQQRFQTGLKYYDQRDFESARLAFTQAYAVIQKPSILQNLAFSELYSNHPLDAVNHFDQYMHDPSVTADQKGRAKRGLDESMKKTGHYAIKVTTDATLTVDGKSPPTSPPSLVHVMPGSHVLESKLAGKTKTVTSEAKAGETTNVDLTLDNVVAVAVPPPVTSPPPPPPVEPPHEPTYTDSFWGWRSVGGIGLVVVGAVGIVVGVAAKSDESSDKDKVNNLRSNIPNGCVGVTSTQCSSLSDAISSRNDASSRATTFFVLGGVVAGVGAGLIASAVIWPHRYKSKSSGFLEHLTPAVGPKQAGFLFSSDF